MTEQPADEPRRMVMVSHEGDLGLADGTATTLIDEQVGNRIRVGQEPSPDVARGTMTVARS
jgi:hypothetical protein